MYWGDIVGIKNIVHIHPPAPHSTSEPTSHNLSLRCLVSCNPVAKVERMLAVAMTLAAGVTAAVATAAVATAAVAVMTAAVATAG